MDKSKTTLSGLGWPLYLVGTVLFNIDMPDAGLITIAIGMLCHWRWWVVAIPVGIASFLIGTNLTNK